MSWSSEFEPGQRDPSDKGRSLNFSEEEIRDTSDFRTTQELARTTLQNPLKESPTNGPSRTVVALTLGLAALALIAFILFVRSSGSGSEDIQSTNGNTDAEPAAALTSLVESLDTTALSFEPGSVKFTPEGLETAEQIRTTLRKSPAETVAIEVRTYSEDSSAKNHNLSQEQASALREFLLEDGLVSERQVAARGLGSADIHLGDQHSHFVTAELPLASVAVQNDAAQDSNFAFAGPPSAWSESGTKALQAIVKVMEEEQDTNIVFNIHTFDATTGSTTSEREEGQPETSRGTETGESARPGMGNETPESPETGEVPEIDVGAETTTSTETGESTATSDDTETDDGDSTEATVVEGETQPAPLTVGLSAIGQPRQLYQQGGGSDIGQSLTTFLTERGVEPSRISITHVDNEPVQIPAGVNTVVSIQTGKPAEVAQVLESTPEIRFVPGNATLDENGRRSLDQVAETLAETSEILLIDVHTFSQQTAEDNKGLSERQAASVAEYLAEQGIEEQRLRTFGSGNSNQFDESGKLTITVLSVIE